MRFAGVVARLVNPGIAANRPMLIVNGDSNGTIPGTFPNTPIGGNGTNIQVQLGKSKTAGEAHDLVRLREKLRDLIVPIPDL
jgi:hypothetical protein